MNKILVVDDDPKLCELISEFLSQYSYQVTTVDHPHQALEMLRSEEFGLVILDVMLPEMDGFTCLKEIRSFSDIPVVMLTARGDTMDRIIGLEVGADDYLSKPFEPRELVARIQVILRRLEKIAGLIGQADQLKLREFGLLKVDLNARQVSYNSVEISLTAGEFDLLALISSEPGKKWSRDEIMNQLHGIESEAMSRSIDIMISRIRYKLQKAGNGVPIIKTIRGTGYCFIGGHGD